MNPTNPTDADSSALDAPVARFNKPSATMSHKAEIAELLTLLDFARSQIERLAYHAFSEEVEGWMRKCDAVNAIDRCLKKHRDAEKTPNLLEH
jgi:hypothetical protein